MKAILFGNPSQDFFKFSSHATFPHSHAARHHAWRRRWPHDFWWIGHIVRTHNIALLFIEFFRFIFSQARVLSTKFLVARLLHWGVWHGFTSYIQDQTGVNKVFGLRQITYRIRKFLIVRYSTCIEISWGFGFGILLTLLHTWFSRLIEKPCKPAHSTRWLNELVPSGRPTRKGPFKKWYYYVIRVEHQVMAMWIVLASA